MMRDFDWSLVQCFLAVAESGSFSAAARRLGLSQPTVGRRIHEIETRLGTPMFRRGRKGQELTETGLMMLEQARAMQAAAARLSLLAAGRRETLSGVVRITASVVVSHYILPPILAGIRQAEPEIELELHASDSTENLLYREADIAVRMYRPEQLDVITRKVGQLDFGLYAARAYLARRGRPRGTEDLRQHDLIGYDRSDLLIKGMRAQGFAVDRSAFALRCDNQTVYRELIRSGAGIGVAAVTVMAQDPEIERLLPETEIPPLPIWLTAPAALRSNRPIRRVYDLLARGLRRAVG